MTFIPEVLAPLENGITLFGFQIPELYGVSNIIMSAFVIFIIIFRRQGIMGYSEIITDSWFSRKTYTSLFKGSEYKNLVKTIVNKFRSIPRCIKSIGAWFSKKFGNANK